MADFENTGCFYEYFGCCIAIFLIVLVVLIVYTRKRRGSIRIGLPSFSRNRDLQDALDKNDRLERSLQKCRVNLELVTKEKEDFQNRLSEVMSSRLRANNPHIADLNDMNRPSKLGERCSELYDNHWTNAFDHIEGRLQASASLDGRIIIDFLLTILEETSKYCKGRTSDVLKAIHDDVKSITDKLACTDTVFPVDIYNRVVSERKLMAIRTIPGLGEMQIMLKKKITDGLLAPFLDSQTVGEYIKECTFLCWLMEAQDPPMAFVFAADDNPERYFRLYTRLGKHIDYVVWPALLLQEGGAIVNKGVAQFHN